MDKLRIIAWGVFKLYGMVSYPVVLLFVLGCIFNNAYLMYTMIAYPILFGLLSYKGVLTQRLNPYFVVHIIPFYKYKIVSQLVNRKHTKTMNCREIIQDLAIYSRAAASELPAGYYRTITHSVVLRRLKDIPNIHILKKPSLGNQSMKSNVSDLMKYGSFSLRRRNCKEDHKTCKKRLAVREFYFVEFFKE